MVLLPRLSANLGESLKPLVLVAGESSSLHLSADGKIVVDSTNSTKRATLATLQHAHELLAEAAASCHGVVLSFDSVTAVVATHQSGAGAPYHAVVLPVLEAPEVQTISLRNLQPPTTSTSEVQGLILFSPKLRKAKLLNTPLPNDHFLHFGPSGGELLVSPVTIVRENDRVWQVTLLTESKQFIARTEKPPAPQILPTPPPSPPGRDSAFSPPLAGSEVPGTDQDSTLTSQEDLVRHVQTPSPSSSNGSRSRDSTHRRRRSLSMMLVRSLPTRLVRAYLHAIFNMVFWFWSVFAKAFVVRLVGEGIPQVITRLLGLAIAKTAARPTGTRGGSSVPSNGVEPSDAMQASKRKPTGAQSVADISEFSRGENGSIVHTTLNRLGAHVQPEPDVPSVSPSSLPSSSGSTKLSEELSTAPRVVVSATLPRKRSFPATMLLCGPSLVKNLCITFSGKSLPPPHINPLEDGIFLVEITGLDGEGELKVAFEL